MYPQRQIGVVMSTGLRVYPKHWCAKDPATRLMSAGCEFPKGGVITHVVIDGRKGLTGRSWVYTNGGEVRVDRPYEGPPLPQLIGMHPA